MGELTKVCKVCGIRKPYSEYHRNRNGYKGKCKECVSEKAHTYWNKNKERLQEQAKERNRRNSEAGKLLVRTYLDDKVCVDCGIADWRVLEFDHVRGEKLGNVCEMMTGCLEKLADEILKCDVICANCHKIRTANRLGSWRSA